MLDPVFGFPTFVRFCWSTTTALLESDAVACEWEAVNEEEEADGEDEEGGDGKTRGKAKQKVKSKPISLFLKRRADASPDAQSSSKRLRASPASLSPFFVDRHLKRVTCLQQLM